MRSESVGGRLATWVAGVLGVWAGLAALGSLAAAMMFPQWALVREPIVLTEAPTRSMGDDVHLAAALQPVVTTVTFRVGLWVACPHINTSHLNMLIGPLPCSGVSYTWDHISYRDLSLPSPAPLVQTVLARMRLSAPFLTLACGLLALGIFLAIVGRCCYSHASPVAVLMYSLAGLSIGVGVVWFMSVVSEEYGMASGRRTSWSSMYAYRYGWSLIAAGSSGVAALIAALLTGHSHLARHAPLVTVLRARSSSAEENLARPLLRCRSEGCLGQRSFTSDTIRTYLTCDSRRHYPRGCNPLPLPHSPSIVDLTRPSEDVSRQQEESCRSHEDPVLNRAALRRSSKNILSENAEEFCKYHQSHQREQDQLKHDHQEQELQQQEQSQRCKHQLSQSLSSWPVTTSQVMIIEAPKGTIAQIVPPPPVSQVLSPVSPVPPPPPLLSSSSSQSSPDGTPPPPPPPSLSPPATVVKTSKKTKETRDNSSSHEPFRLPEYNSFTVRDYSRTLPTEGRQMAVFSRRAKNRSSTLTRPSSKISSEV